MLLGEIIKQYRLDHKMSLQDFANLIGTSRSYIHMLEKNINPSTNKPINPSIETLKLLANAMHMDLELLLKKLDDEQSIYLDEHEYKEQFKTNFSSFTVAEEDLYNEYNKQVLALLGVVKAGYDYLASENIIGHINIDRELSNPEEYFALKVTGDSMQPVLYEGDIVVVHKQNDVESGQVAIVLIDNEEATVKKVIKYDDYIELVAFNSYYPPRKLDKNSNFKIIGKVIEARISKIFE